MEEEEEEEQKPEAENRVARIYLTVSDRAIKLSHCGSDVGRGLVRASRAARLTSNGTRLLSAGRKERKRGTSKGGG